MELHKQICVSTFDSAEALAMTDTVPTSQDPIFANFVDRSVKCRKPQAGWIKFNVDRSVKCRKPQAGWIKFNVDVSFRSNPSSAGAVA